MEGNVSSNFHILFYLTMEEYIVCEQAIYRGLWDPWGSEGGERENPLLSFPSPGSPRELLRNGMGHYQCRHLTTTIIIYFFIKWILKSKKKMNLKPSHVMNDWGLVKVAGIVEDGTKASEKIKTKTEIKQKHVTFPRWARESGWGEGAIMYTS